MGLPSIDIFVFHAIYFFQVVREVQNVDRLKLDLNQKGIIDTADKDNSNDVANLVVGADGVKTHLAGNVNWKTSNGVKNQQLQQQSGSMDDVG